MKGHAVVFTNKNEVTFQEIALPKPTSSDVVVEVKYSWISPGTESSFLRGERITGEKMYSEGDPWPFPQIAGYQKVGKVIEVGSEVENIEKGDWVFASVSHVKDMYFPFGGHVNPAITDKSQVWKIPRGEDPLAYAGLVLTQVGVNCGMRPPVKTNDVAVIIGDGLVGHWTAQTLVHRGAEVYVIGRHPSKLENLPVVAHKINEKNQDIAQFFNESTISIVVDTVGAMGTVQKLFPHMKRDSHWVSAGFLGNTGLIDIQTLREKEITLYTPSGWNKERMDLTLEGILNGWLQTLPLITHHFPSHHAADAWNLILNKKEPYLGVILEW